MLAIISKRKYFYVISSFLVVASIFMLSVWGLKFGIDFTGGTQMNIRFSQDVPDKNEIENKLANLNLSGLSIQPGSDNTALLRYKNSDDEINNLVFEKIKELDENSVQLSLDFIGSSISGQLKRNAVEAIALAVIGIALYIAWAFRKVSRPVASWKYGLGAVIALAHDILITVGIFVFLGKIYGIEVGIPFIAALLTIIGYSVNDTIVVYDRTRENLIKSSSKEGFEEIINKSLNETLARSINTSLTVILVLFSLVFFGGSSIRDFSLALLIGIVFGTYSSIYVASALLVTIYKFQSKS